MKNRTNKRLKTVQNQVKLLSTELSDSEYQYLVVLTGCTEKEIKGLFEKFKTDNCFLSKVDKIKFMKLFNNAHVLNVLNGIYEQSYV